MKKKNKAVIRSQFIASSFKKPLNDIKSDNELIRTRSTSPRSNNNSFARIYEVVKKIPKGKVMTYKQVSILANVATPRVVGFALHVNADPQNIPCHRVVFADGSLTTGYAFGGEGVQRERLANEGVTFNNKGNVDLEKCLVL